MAMLKAIVGQMARFVDRLTDTERGLIDQAVNRVWEDLGRAGSVEAVAAAQRFFGAGTPVVAVPGTGS